MILLLKTPSHLSSEVFIRILQINQIVSCSDEHFWTFSSSTVVGTIHLQVLPDADRQDIITQVRFQRSSNGSIDHFQIYLGSNDFE